MNSTKKAFAIAVAALMLVGVTTSTYLAKSASALPAVQDSSATEFANYVTQLEKMKPAVRSDAQLDVDISRHGMEPNAAGFHLLRPNDDPMWSALYGTLAPSQGNSWYLVPTRYPAFECQRKLPTSLVPVLDSPTWQVAERRLFGNTIGSYNVTASADGSYQVSMAFSSLGRRILTSLLSPREVAGDGSFVDWFGTSRPAGFQSDCQFVVVSNDRAYVPVSGQAVLSGGSPPASVVIATGLSVDDANELVRKLGIP